LKVSPAVPETPAVSDCQKVRLIPGQRLRTRVAGIFLFLPLLARLRFDHLVQQAGYPGSRMVPALSALLSLLVLKLLDKERHSHISDFNFDEALGLFAGLNVLPKKSYATDYSYRTQRCHQRQLLVGWVAALAPVLFPQGDTFALDFHPIPYRGDPAGLENHFVSTRGKACPSVQSFFAQEHDSRVLCYANTALTRENQAGEVMRFVEFWHEVSGQDPRWLYFDSKVTSYAELNWLNNRDIRFITIRKRGAAVIRRLLERSASDWQGAVIDIPKRRHKRIRFVDDTIRLRDYDVDIRQVAVTGLGREQPTLFLSNDVARDETARSLVIRYAGRNSVEDGLGQSVNFFHLDCLASEVQLNVDVDAALTVVANGCYRWLARQLRSYDKAAAKQVYRKFVETAGVVEVRDDEIVVRFDKRSHNPILREAAINGQAVPWLQGRPIRFEFP
jgi:hypothetical protein